MAIDKYALAFDPRFQALSASDKRLVLSGEIDINQVVNLAEAEQQVIERQTPPLPEPPRETTWGEFAQGVGSQLARGITGGLQSAVATGAEIQSRLPAQMIADLITGENIDKRRQALAQSAQPIQEEITSWIPETYQEELSRPIIGRNEQGNFTGFNVPTAEQVIGTVSESLGYIPQFVAGGGLAGTLARSGQIGRGLANIIGLGVGGASATATNQYADTFNEVRDALLQEGRSEEEASRIAGEAAREAERNTAALSFVTSGLGGALAARLGGASSSPLSGAAKGFIGDALFEAPEEAGQTAISQLSGARGQLDTREIEQAAALGAIAGGGPGAVIGAFSYDPAVREASAVAKELSKEVDNTLAETLKQDIAQAKPSEDAPLVEDLFSGELTPVRPERAPVEETPLPTRTAISQELPLENTADFAVLRRKEVPTPAPEAVPTPSTVIPETGTIPAATPAPAPTQEVLDEEGLASPEEIAEAEQAGKTILPEVEKDARVARVISSLANRGLNDVNVYYEPPKQGETGITQGRFNIDTGKLELNAAALEDDADVAAVAVHEINHALNQAKDQGVTISRRDLTSVVGSERRGIVNNRIRALAQTYPEMKRAVDRATQAGVRSQNPEVGEIELLSYALEEITKTRESGKKLGPRLKTFVRDMVAQVKGFLANNGFVDLSKSFNEADLYRLGKVMMKEYASGTRPRPEKGGGTLESFGGVKAAKANIGNYARAEEMDVAGEDPKTIWEQTGWRKGKDNKWRFEIDDSKATLKPSFRTVKEAPAQEVFDNPDVFENYPQLRSIPIKREDLGKGRRGYFSIKDGKNSISVDASLGDAEAKSVILHEMQHAIQVIEGFARGGTPDSVFNQMNNEVKENIKRDLEVNLENNRRTAKERLDKARQSGDEKKQKVYSKLVLDATNRLRQLKSGGETELKEEMKKQGNLRKMYENLLGEVEARNVQFREEMTAEERARSFPEGTEDTPVEDQVVVGSGETAASEGDITETPAFKKWFGNSKVVDENGKPKVVYHGTAADVEFFDPLALGANTEVRSAKRGFFFAASPKVASGYALLSESRPFLKVALFKNASESEILSPEMRAFMKRELAKAPEMERRGPNDPLPSNREFAEGNFIEGTSGEITDIGMSGANVIPVYLSLQNPMVVDYQGSEYRERTFASVMKEAKELGHDGVIFRNAEDSMKIDYAEITDIYAVFDNTQIKSVFNKGAFDRTNRNILESRRAAPAKAEKKVTKKEQQKVERTAPEPGGRAGPRMFENIPGAGKGPTKTTKRSASAIRKAMQLGPKTIANLVGSLGGKNVEIVAILENLEGMKYEALLSARQAGERMQRAVYNFKDKSKRPEVLRNIALASSENKDSREAAREWLKTNAPKVYVEYTDFRNAIRLFGLEIAQNILHSGRPLTKRDIAVVKAIQKNAETYINRSYKAYAKSGAVRQEWRQYIMDGVEKAKKSGEPNEASMIYEDAVEATKKNYLDISNFLQEEKKEGEEGGYRGMTLEEVKAIADLWLGNESPVYNADMTPEQRENFRNRTAELLNEKWKALQADGTYEQKLEAKAQAAIQSLLGEFDGSSNFSKIIKGVTADRTIVTKRQFVPEEIRKLLGEVVNPIAQLETTRMLQAEFIGTQQALNNLYDVALRNKWIVPVDQADADTYTSQFPDSEEARQRFGNLAGMASTEDFFKAVSPVIEMQASLRDALVYGDKPLEALVENSMGYWTKATSLTKMFSVAYNAMNPVFNFVGGGVFTPIVNGFALAVPTPSNIRALKFASKAVLSSLNADQRTTMSEEFKTILRAGLQDAIEVQELQEGARESLRNQVLDNIAKDVTDQKTALLNSLGEAGKLILKKLPVWATAESDRFWVYAVFDKERQFLEDYYKAKGIAVTPREIDSQAAERTKQANINPARSGKLIRGSERLGFTQYLNYFVETGKSLGRASYLALSDLKVAAEDAKNGDTEAARLRAIRGMTRLAGTMAGVFANKLILVGLREAAKAAGLVSLIGLSFSDDEEEEIIQNLVRMMPPQDQAKTWKILGKTGDTYYLQDVNRIDPYEPATAPINSIVNGEYERAYEQAKSIFFNNALLTQTIAAFSETERKAPLAYSHSELYNKIMKGTEEMVRAIGVDDPSTATEIVNGLLKPMRTLTPRVALDWINRGFTEKSLEEGMEGGKELVQAIRMAGGYVLEANPERMVQRAVFNQDGTGFDQIRSSLRKDISNLSSDDPEQIRKTLAVKMQREMDAWEKLRETYVAGHALATDKGAFNRMFKDKVNDNAVYKSVVDGQFKSTLFTKKVKEGYLANAKDEERQKIINTIYDVFVNLPE